MLSRSLFCLGSIDSTLWCFRYFLRIIIWSQVLTAFNYVFVWLLNGVLGGRREANQCGEFDVVLRSLAYFVGIAESFLAFFLRRGPIPFVIDRSTVVCHGRQVSGKPINKRNGSPT
ncbi:MAG: hypothetical protein Udaeo2_20590 [Candidatus Udaeobacter sp.]|nr:MAG: hypothetical protein Udaeo2_20590 [Candidatus Udaeobacter sp.]